MMSTSAVMTTLCCAPCPEAIDRATGVWLHNKKQETLLGLLPACFIPSPCLGFIQVHTNILTNAGSASGGREKQKKDLTVMSSTLPQAILYPCVCLCTAITLGRYDWVNPVRWREAVKMSFEWQIGAWLRLLLWNHPSSRKKIIGKENSPISNINASAGFN